MTCRPQPQSGMSLIEALMASAVLGIGMMGATQLTLQAFQAAQDTRQRGVAQSLAQEAMDCASVNRNTCPLASDVTIDGVRYTRQVQINPRGNGGLFDVKVTVDWPTSLTTSASASRAEVTMEWHSSYAQIPTWVGVSLP